VISTSCLLISVVISCCKMVVCGLGKLVNTYTEAVLQNILFFGIL